MTLCVFEDSPVCAVCGRPARHVGVRRECGDAARGPTLATRVRNFVAAAAQHVAAGMPMATEEEIASRHEICLGCEHLVDGACAQCGCPVSRMRQYVSKLAWADSQCPVGKWGPANAARKVV